MGRPATCECGACQKCKHKIYQRSWYRKNQRSYADPERRREYEMGRYHGDPEYRLRKKARNAISIRLKRGTMTRGDCAMCGLPDAQAHHNDYERPLDVVWLCEEHHTVIHGPLPTEA